MMKVQQEIQNCKKKSEPVNFHLQLDQICFSCKNRQRIGFESCINTHEAISLLSNILNA